MDFKIVHLRPFLYLKIALLEIRYPIKNIAIIANVSDWIAAEDGGVHLFYLDSISKKYAIEIEKCNTIEMLNNLNYEMPLEYCNLVRKYSSKGHSPFG